MAKIYARKIHDGGMTIVDVPIRWREATREAYIEIYGEPCPEP